MENLKKITIGGIEYPYKIDLNVLEKIQEEYGTIGQFERVLIGLEFMTDEKGNQMYTENGEPRMWKVAPKIRAIRMVLPWMINEGREIEAEDTGRSWEPVTEAEIARKCDIPYTDLAEIIHEEFSRCFSAKKNRIRREGKVKN